MKRRPRRRVRTVPRGAVSPTDPCHTATSSRRPPNHAVSFNKQPLPAADERINASDRSEEPPGLHPFLQSRPGIRGLRPPLNTNAHVSASRTHVGVCNERGSGGRITSQVLNRPRQRRPPREKEPEKPRQQQRQGLQSRPKRHQSSRTPCWSEHGRGREYSQRKS